MVFGFSAKERKGVSSLTEQDIRNRLYGSAVGTCVDTTGRPDKRQKEDNNKVLFEGSAESQDSLKIRDELTSLRAELEQAKKRLKRLRNVNTKQIRLVFIYIILGFSVVLFMLFAVNKISSMNNNTARTNTAKADSAGIARYAVQIAVFDKLTDAKRLQTGLEARGYRPFIHKSSFASGKDKFTIYAGAFQDRTAAQNLVDTLKTQENIKDAFISNVPEQR
jgi:hypothetical protein